MDRASAGGDRDGDAEKAAPTCGAGGQVRAGRLAPNARRFLDLPDRSTQSLKRQYLLLVFVAQDVGHPGEGPFGPPPRQRPGALSHLAGFEVSITGRFWAYTEGSISDRTPHSLAIPVEAGYVSRYVDTRSTGRSSIMNDAGDEEVGHVGSSPREIVLPKNLPLSVDRGIRWQGAHSNGVRVERTPDAWHAGRVNAVLGSGPVAVVGTDGGGVWIVNPNYDAIPQFEAFHAVPLSFGWDLPNVTALAWGREQRHVYAGSGGSGLGALHLLELRTTPGALEPVDQWEIPIPQLGEVTSILVLPSISRVVLGGSFGLSWSIIPSNPSDSTSYAWNTVAGISGVGAGGLAAGPQNSVLAATSPGMWVGTWANAALEFVKSSVAGLDIAGMGRTSVASCAGHRSTAYALTTMDGETVGAVLGTVDGGLHWTPVNRPGDALVGPIPPGGHALNGHVLWYANCIDVSPVDENVVAVGWSSGPFISQDGGKTWRLPNDNSSTDHLHADLHALSFSWAESNPNALFVGHDGGISYTENLGSTYDSRYNAHLPTLEFYGGDLGASNVVPGLYGGGTQDNGDLWGLVDASSATAPLHNLDDGDGGPMRFLDNGLLLRYWNTQSAVKSVPWSSTASSLDKSHDVVVALDGNPAGLMSPILETVREPTFKDSAAMLMYACAASGSTILGLFAAEDGSNGHFSTLAEFETTVSAIASFNGTEILVGTVNGRIVVCDTASGRFTETDMSQVPLPGARIDRLLCGTSRHWFAMAGGFILHWEKDAWRGMSGGPGAQCAAIEFSRSKHSDAGRLFGATDWGVYVSDDIGVSWTDASFGLPRRAHVSDLRLARQTNGEQWLYLATYGWGVWRARVDDIEDIIIPHNLKAEVLRILVGVVEGGGGTEVTLHGKVIHIPPSGPVTDVAALLVVANIASHLKGHSGRALVEAAGNGIRAIWAKHGRGAISPLEPFGMGFNRK